ncbi:chaperone NapD [Candidatus Thioglobus sp.]|uniref:chaperone NapD n=1 Tax=Candidatus Thioglobus sp. TaxID=2026721 RepID=UPI003D138DF9
MAEKNHIDICGMLVQVLKNKAQQVEDNLNAIAGVEVHGLSADNQLVVIIEQDTQAKIIDTIDGFNAISGVISTQLVYQHSESI